jgi:hypothetical protein
MIVARAKVGGAPWLQLSQRSIARIATRSISLCELRPVAKGGSRDNLPNLRRPPSVAKASSFSSIFCSGGLFVARDGSALGYSFWRGPSVGRHYGSASPRTVISNDHPRSGAADLKQKLNRSKNFEAQKGNPGDGDNHSANDPRDWQNGVPQHTLDSFSTILD